MEYFIKVAKTTKSKYPLVLASDLLRLYVVFHYGGIYVDIDAYFLKNIDWIVDSIDSFHHVYDWMNLRVVS